MYWGAQTRDLADKGIFFCLFFRKKRADPVSSSSLMACLSALLYGKRHVCVVHKFLVPS